MNKKFSRMKRAVRTRRKICELNAKRLVVHRTPRHIYAQITTENGSKTLAFASTLEKNINKKIKYTGNKKASEIVGKLIAERSIKKGIERVSFDRSGFKYHGRIQVLADAARKNGLKF